jgi:5-methylcytosine-specific restriction protein A
MAKWPYNTTNWQRLRHLKLSADPYCEVCRRGGRLVQANTVDHIVAIRNGGEAFPRLEELMSMCERCHNRKTGFEQTGGAAIRIYPKGCDASGLPLDGAHPFWGNTPSKDGKLGGRGPRGARKIGK